MTEIAEAVQRRSSFGVNSVEEWGLCKWEEKNVHSCKKICMRVLWEPANYVSPHWKESVRACQQTALHRKTQYRVNSSASGTLSALAKTPPHSRCWRKTVAQVLKRARCVNNGTEYWTREEDLCVSITLFTPLPPANRRKKQSHLWLWFGFKWRTGGCSLLKDMIQMFKQQESYSTQAEPRGP